MQARNGSNKAKPETVSDCPTTRLQPVKSLEHVLVLSSRNSRSIIGNGDDGGAFAVFRDLNGYVPGRATVFDCIVYKIGDRIEDEIAIASNRHSLVSNKV